MNIVDGNTIKAKLKELFIKISFEPETLKNVTFIKDDMQSSEHLLASVLDENLAIAKNEGRPLCQDCGLAQVFIEKGKSFDFSSFYSINSLVEEAVREAYIDGNLRKSVVANPFERVNTKDNTPPIIHLEEVDGSGIKIYAIAKGGGSENVSRLGMLAPAEGREGVADFVIETLKKAGGKGCPPYFIGVGVGGSFDSVATVAKKALITQSFEDRKLYDLIDEKISELDYGVLGFPGKYPVKDIFIKTAPTHIAMMPVAVSLNCHSFRMGQISF